MDLKTPLKFFKSFKLKQEQYKPAFYSGNRSIGFGDEFYAIPLNALRVKS